MSGQARPGTARHGPARHDPARHDPHDAFDELISPQPRVRLTNGLFLMGNCIHCREWSQHPFIWVATVARGTCKVRGCKNWPLSYNSGMDGPIVTKFGVCLEIKPRCILCRSWVGYIRAYAHAHVHMCPFSVSRKRLDQLR